MILLYLVLTCFGDFRTVVMVLLLLLLLPSVFRHIRHIPNEVSSRAVRAHISDLHRLWKIPVGRVVRQAGKWDTERRMSFNNFSM